MSKPISAIDCVEGAAIMVALATNLEKVMSKNKDTKIEVRREDAVALVKALKLSAMMIDVLTMSLERGERFKEKLPK